MTCSPIELLTVARRIANYAKEEGALQGNRAHRTRCDHLGAVLADSILQAGLNYSTVVRPRVQTILRVHPYLLTVSSLVTIIQKGETSSLLNWRHHEKLRRFEELVAFLQSRGIQDVHDLRASLISKDFCNALQKLNGIGPKTVDYMACLVGIDSIACLLYTSPSPRD